jgi:cytochrome c553
MWSVAAIVFGIAASELPESAPFRPTHIAALLFALAASIAQADESTARTDVKYGHDLAVMICANCHVVADDQPSEPILRPSAPDFLSIANSKNYDASSLKLFLNSTHSGSDRPNGMPFLPLLDEHISPIADYLTNLRAR